jgi:large subunit ribosomal protein L2
MFQKFKPTTPSRRHLIRLNKDHLNKKPLLKNKIIGKKNSVGRNHTGKITVSHKGGGVKKCYRKIDFTRTDNSVAIVCTLENDPNRNCFIAAVCDLATKNFYYILAPQHLIVGDIVKSGLEIKPSLGSSLPLSEIPEGSIVCNVSPKLSIPGQIARAAGTFAVVKEKVGENVLLQLSSGTLKSVSSKCFAVIGDISNNTYFLTRLGKAGQSRWLNKRPTVRGVAMNPIDHPHGGGEGKKSGQSKTPWGKPNRRGRTGRSYN